MKKQDERFNDDTASNAYTDAHRAGRNLLINGDFRVWQRGSTFAGADKYTADRWKVDGNDFSITTQSQTSTAPPLNGVGKLLRLTIGSLGATDIPIRQTLESIDSYALAGKEVTLSAYVRVTGGCLSDVTMTVRTGTGIDEEYPATGATDHSKGFANAEVAGDYFTRIQSTVTIPQNATQVAVAIRHANNISPIGGFLDIAMVQLEVGGVATPFDHRPVGLELALCQRYFCKSYAQDNTPATVVDGGYLLHNISSTWMAGHERSGETFPVNMRTVPTVHLYSANTGTIDKWDKSGTNNINIGSIGVSSVRFRLKNDTGADIGLPASAHVYGHYTADAEL